MKFLRFGIVLLAVLSLGLPPVASQPGPLQFVDATVASGIDAAAPDWGFIAVGDYNRDGFDDLVLNLHPGIAFYRNNANGTFSRVFPTGIPPSSDATKHRHIFLWCDLDRDGDEEFIIGTGLRGPNDVDPHVDPANSRDLWLRNDGPDALGAPRFVDVAAQYGTQNLGSNVQAITCFDSNRDQRLDVLVLDGGISFSPPFTKLMALYVNHLPTGFTNEAVLRGLGVDNDPTISIYSAVCDDMFRYDGWTECVTGGNQFSRWFLQGVRLPEPGYFPANGTFYITEGSPDEWDPGHIGALGSYNFEIALADVNNDGFTDAIRADYNSDSSVVQVVVICGGNTVGGGAPFRKCYEFSRASPKGAVHSIAVGDFDNDGDQDFFANRFGEEQLQGRQAGVAGMFFRNDGMDSAGNPQFTEIGEAAGLAGPGAGQIEWGAGASAVIDYNRDGRLDLVVHYGDVNQTIVRPYRLYRNITSNGNAWVGLILKAPVILGSRVEIQACGARQVQYLSARTGWLAQDSRNVHFGLGSCAQSPRVTIRWPDGTVSEGTVPANAYHTVPPLPNPPGPTPTPTPAPPTPTPPPPTPVPTPTRTPRGDRPPRVQIVSGVREVSIQKPAWIVALATDDEGIQSVTFDVDGIQLPPARSSVTPPYYAAMWDTRDRRWASGWHTITVTVTDTAGQTARDSIRLFLRR